MSKMSAQSTSLSQPSPIEKNTSLPAETLEALTYPTSNIQQQDELSERLEEAKKAEIKYISENNPLKIPDDQRASTQAQIAELSELLKSNPEQSVAIYMQLAVSETGLENKGKAIEYLDLALAELKDTDTTELKSQKIQVLLTKGTVLTFENKLEEAVDAYEQALKLDPENIGTHLQLAQAYRFTGEYKSSIASANKLIELAEKAVGKENFKNDPLYGVAYHYLGLSLLHDGQIAEGIKALETGFPHLNGFGKTVAIDTLVWLYTKGPDKTLHNPERAQQLRPTANPQRTAKAIRTIEQNLSEVTPTQWLRQGLKETSVPWLVAHQIQAFGPNEQRVQYLLNLVKFDDKQRPYFPVGTEGHPAQYIVTLIRAGIPLDKEFTVNDKKVTLEKLIEGIHDRLDHENIGGDDASWIIEALTHKYSFDDKWESEKGVETSIETYIRYMVGNLQRAARLGNFMSEGVACGTFHFGNSIARIHESFKGKDVGNKELIEQFPLMLDQLQQQLFSRAMKEHSESSRQLLEDCKENPNRVNAIKLASHIVVIGHGLELALDKEGYYYDKFSNEEIERLAATVENLVETWFSEEFEETREKIGKTQSVGRSTNDIAINGELMHVYRGLKLLQAYREAKKKDK